MAEEEKQDVQEEPLTFSYGLCIAMTLLPAIFYLFSRSSYYHWRSGLYALPYVAGDILLCLLVMVPSAALLKRFLHRPKVWRGCVLAAVFILWCAFCAWNGSRPVPYLREMLEEMPRAAEYFHAHKEELEREARETGSTRFPYEPPAGSPAHGYGHDMCFYYVEAPEDYPKREGQRGISAYVHFLDEHWYLYMDSLLGG